MEILRYLKTEIELARIRREEERRRKSLESFFQKQQGKDYLAETLKRLNIEKFRNEGIEPVNNEEIRDFRLIIYVRSEVFFEALSILTPRPDEIRYRITNTRDELSTGELLVELNERIAMRTSGTLYYDYKPPENAEESLFKRARALGYEDEALSSSSSHSPFSWRRLVRKN